MSELPTGVVLVFLDEDGDVIAEVSDFNASGYGGYTLHESQRLRARKNLAVKVVSTYASPQLVRAIDSYDAEKHVRTLVEKFGCRVHEILIGKDTR